MNAGLKWALTPQKILGAYNAGKEANFCTLKMAVETGRKLPTRCMFDLDL